MDEAIRGILADGMATAIVVKSTDMVEEARRQHDLWPVPCAALGRALTAGVMMGSAIKSPEGRVTLTLKGDGPLGAVVVAAKPGGEVKGYVDNPRVDLPLQPSGKLDVGGALGKEGRVTVIRSLGQGEPYVGQCPLSSGEIAEDIAAYYLMSEQQPTLLALGVLIAPEGNVLSAGGVMVQTLPGCDESLIGELEDAARFMENIAALMENSDGAQSAFDFLFQRFQGRVLQRFTPRYTCDCSRERMQSALVALGREELASLAGEGHAELVCHFCNRKHHFDGEELWALYRDAGGKP